jgi:arsenite-transporting ATPase
MQQKYVREAYDLYGEDFHLIKLPLGTEEVRGVERLRECVRSLTR